MPSAKIQGGGGANASLREGNLISKVGNANSGGGGANQSQ